MIRKLVAMACLTSSLLLGGCAGAFFTNVGYIKSGLDVASYIATKKGTTDHALSAYMKKDCALHRVITKKKICKLTKKQIAPAKKKKALKQRAIVPPTSINHSRGNVIPQLVKDIEKNNRILRQLAGGLQLP